MNNIMGAIQNTISISLFNRGLAGKIFDEVKRCDAKVVMKNNVPECVLMPPIVMGLFNKLGLSLFFIKIKCSLIQHPRLFFIPP